MYEFKDINIIYNNIISYFSYKYTTSKLFTHGFVYDKIMKCDLSSFTSYLIFVFFFTEINCILIYFLNYYEI